MTSHSQNQYQLSIGARNTPRKCNYVNGPIKLLIEYLHTIPFGSATPFDAADQDFDPHTVPSAPQGLHM